MKKSRLYTLLSSLGQEEFIRFEQFLASPYFNKNQDCLSIFQVLKPYLLVNECPPDKMGLLEAVYGDTNKLNSLNTAMSKLTRLLDEFFTQEQLNTRPYFKKHLLLQNLLKREQFKYLETVYKDVITGYEKVQRKRVSDYLDFFLLTYNWLEYHHIAKPSDKGRHPNQTIRALDKYYIIQRFALSREAADLKRIHSMEYDETSLKRVIYLAEESGMLNHFFVNLYYTALLTIIEYEKTEHFEQLIEIIDANHEVLELKELNTLLIILTNYCARQILDGNIEYYRTLFTIFQKVADYGALFVEKYMSGLLLKNIVTVGIRVKEFDSTTEFLEAHSSYLKPEIRNSVYCFNKAALYFHQQQYEEALDYLNQMDRLDFNFEADRKTLILRAYYELDEPIAYDGLNHSFREYIRTQRHISMQRRAGYLNFVKATNLLYSIKEKKTPEKIKNLETKINGYQQLNCKDWLLEKVRELKSIKSKS